MLVHRLSEIEFIGASLEYLHLELEGAGKRRFGRVFDAFS